MEPMVFYLTILVALLLFARVEYKLQKLDKRVTRHIESVDNRLASIDSKLDQLLMASGAIAANRNIGAQDGQYNRAS